MKRMLTVALIGLLTGCATPTEVRVSDKAHRPLEPKVGWTDQSTVNKCVSNMISAAPADEAVDIQARHIGSGKTITVDVDATLLNVGRLATSMAVGYRCEYQNGLMAKGYWTHGLK